MCNLPLRLAVLMFLGVVPVTSGGTATAAPAESLSPRGGTGSLPARALAGKPPVPPEGRMAAAEPAKVLRAGAAAVDISPREFPVRVVGGFIERTATKVVDPLFARSLVLDDNQTRVAIVVVDTCVLPRDICDSAKERAFRETGIPVDHMLISATHTHSAPAVVGALGTDADENYRKHVAGWIAKAVGEAAKRLAPARIGWTAVEDPEHTHCRRWIRRPDRIDLDPFGHRTVRAMMHPGCQNPDYLGPSGPSDPDLSIVSVQSTAGRPIALLANYSMHYVGAEPVSADYFGAFGRKIAELMGVTDTDPPFVGILSNGTSGDQWYMDYGKPRKEHTVNSMVDALGGIAFEACKRIEYHDWVPLAMRESRLPLEVRPIPDEDLARAREAFAKAAERKPQDFKEVYPREQVLLSRMPPTRELKLQALRIGDLGIAAIPCEVFAISGLKIKAASPLGNTFTIELANGYDGYIPPPEQHLLGGYTTWRARSSCLEVTAEPKIVDEVLGLLEQVAGKPRRSQSDDDCPFGEYPRAVRESRPVAYWRLNEWNGPQAQDASGKGHHAAYDGAVAYYLDGPTEAETTPGAMHVNRAPQLAGGHIRAPLAGLADRYSVEMWFRNDMPADARETTGHLYSRLTDALAIGGHPTAAGKLLFKTKPDSSGVLVGRSVIRPHEWHHLAAVRDGRRVAVFLDGGPTPEITGEIAAAPPSQNEDLLIGSGRHDSNTLEGSVDEVAVYDRALSADEITRHYRSVMPASRPAR